MVSAGLKHRLSHLWVLRLPHHCLIPLQAVLQSVNQSQQVRPLIVFRVSHARKPHLHLVYQHLCQKEVVQSFLILVMVENIVVRDLRHR